ncbi:MAG TPA: ribonuclease Z [Polyangiaceae bacterium]|nr:ribonuclease Z [Polyangiaceae bacterium]
MSTRELVVLGSSSQVPTRYRNHNGYLLLWDDEGLLFDPGEGTQRQMIYAEVSASQITKILVTHFHGDHCLGLASMIQRISLDRVPQTIDVFFPASGAVYFERLRYASIYYDQARLAPRPLEAEGVVHESPAFTIEARRLDHGVEAFGYRLQERGGRTMLPGALAEAGVSGPAVGRLLREGEVKAGERVVRLDEVSVERKGQSVAFVMDTRPCAAALELARGVDLLVCESTYLSSEASEAHAHGHMTAADAASIAREAGVGRLVLTHFSQRYVAVEPFEDEARAIFADAVAARDGRRVAVPKRARVS